VNKSNSEKNKKNKKLVLLDAYAIIHRAYHALPDFSSQQGEPTGALYGVSAMLLKILKDLKPDYLAACYDLPKPTYRHELYSEYKLGRLKPDEALIRQINRSRDLFYAFNIPIYEYPGFEADDILGTIVEKLKKEDVDIIIASGDMDALQLVKGEKVRVYTLKKGINDTILYDEKSVVSRFGFRPKNLVDYKGLRGDPSDNIVGIKGIGEKTATFLIQNFSEIENIYQQLEEDETVFLEKGLTTRVISLLKDNKEEALFSKELATIRRDAPINFVLPQQTWKTGVDKEKIISLFREFGFRTLTQRVSEFLDGGNSESEVVKNKKEVIKEKINEKELQGVLVALWLLNSDLTKPTREDIFSVSRKKSFSEARKSILDEINKKKLDLVLNEIELPLIPVIEKMSKVGVKLNTNYLKKISKEYHQEADKLKEKIWNYADGEFNINSPQQLTEVLFEKLSLRSRGQKRTSTGKQSTQESELRKMVGVHPIIEEILKYRELQKLLSTYIDNLPKLVDKNSRIHATFLQTGTTTGRLSSNNPNMQNIPTRTELGKKIREAFEAPEGFDLVAFDYSQIELRVAAVLSGDKKMIEIFKSGKDVHTAVAAEIFNVSLDRVNGEMRRKAKVVNFGIIYGMGLNALRQNLAEASDGVEEIKRIDAQRFYQNYFDKFKTLSEYLEEAKKKSAQLGYTKTLFGRIRYFKGINSKIPYIKASAERMAVNAPIQGTSADIIKLAMVKVHKYLIENKLEEQIKMLLQVHDELIFEVSKLTEAKHILKIKNIMETVLPPEETRGVIFEVNIKKGKNWNNLTPIS